MKERLGVEAIRLQAVNGRLKVSVLSDAGTAPSDASNNWGRLYAVSHAVNHGVGAERVCDRVEGVARETYRRSPGGVTNRLRQSVRNANRYLYLRNRVRRKGGALLAALSCVAIRDMDAYACGVGPGGIVILSRGRVRSFVNPAQWGEQSLEQDWRCNGFVLGRSADLSDPKFSYRQILPGDWLLIMAGGHAGDFLEAGGALATVMGEYEVEAAAEHLAGVLGNHADLSALLLRSMSKTAWVTDGPPPSGGGTARRFASSEETSVLLGQVDGGDEAAEGGCQVSRESSPHRKESAALKDARSLAQSLKSQLVADFGGERREGSRRRPRQRHQFLEQSVQMCRLAGTLILSLILGLWRGSLRLFRWGLHLVRRIRSWVRHHRVTERLARGFELALVGVWAASKGLIVRILPESQGPTVTYGASARPMARVKVSGFHPSPKSRAVIGGLIIVAVVALVATAALRVKSRLKQADIERLASQVEDTLLLAQREDDRDATMALLAEAQELIDQAPVSQRDSYELSHVIEGLDSQWDALAGAVRVAFGANQMLAIPDGMPRRLLIVKGNLYVLDETGQRLYRYVLDQQGELIPDQEPWIWELEPAAESASLSEIIDIEWMDAANGRATPALLMLTAEGSVLELNSAGGVRPVAISDVLQWKNAQALRTYSGNLYVLDLAHESIMKYIPSGDDYQQPPVDYLQGSVDIQWTSVIDMAIDGSVYLLLSNGSIMKFAAGAPQPFPLEGLYPPLENPEAIFASPDSLSVFVAEPAQARIVEFNRDGQFIRQFRAARDGEDPFADLRAFVVDVSHNRLLIGTATGLFNTDVASSE
ncbi:MAG: hypothetical protein CEE40_00805 [Chloroflexi bacterium B3_Chlor]|nr:MAG: hypothetical protein CEE40_00805 [Chloroflexi bacterium B3_Chlor]